jgi:2-phosphoglycerate kinase
MTTFDSARQLDHVFWLGGSPCAGKSSITEILAGRFDLEMYHVDQAFEVHAQYFDPALHPTLTKWRASSWNQRWMQPIETLVQNVIACYQEHFMLILADILSKPKDKPLLVEGTALLPRQVAGVLAERNRAIWVVPTAGFQTEHYSQREWVHSILEQCDNSEVAFHNWMERDAEFARWLAAEVDALGLELLRVEGRDTIEENAMKVASHFQLTAGEPSARFGRS